MLKDTLKSLRISKGLTKQEVAEGAGLTLRQYIAYEYGERDVSTETLVKLADFFKVTTDYLLEREKETNPLNLLDNLSIKPDTITTLERYMQLPEKQKQLLIDFMILLKQSENDNNTEQA
jgi:transcriptional regulator with XRE-family HTH domain